MKAPRYAVIPAELLFDMPDLPDHLFRTYVVMLGLAWCHEYAYCNESLEELADILSSAENPLSAEAVAKRLRQLAELGLIERRRVGRNRWRTYLIVNYSTNQSVSQPKQSANQPARSEPREAVTLTGGKGQKSVTLTRGKGQEPVTLTGSKGQEPVTLTGGKGQNNNNNIVVDVDDSDSQSTQNQQQQQQQHNIAHSRRLLIDYGVHEPTASDLAALEWVTPDVIRAWTAAIDRMQNVRNRPGVLVTRLGKGAPPPPPPEPARDRYLSGKYADLIQR